MLNYLKKFALEILPSVAATVIGAYIVNHYISRPATDAPVAAAVGPADTRKADPKPADGSADVAGIPAPGVKARGISERAMMEKSAAEKPAEVKPAEMKPTEAKASETASAPTEPRRHGPAPKAIAIHGTSRPAATSSASHSRRRCLAALPRKESPPGQARAGLPTATVPGAAGRHASARPRDLRRSAMQSPGNAISRN